MIKTRPTTLSFFFENMLLSRKLFDDIKTEKHKPRNDIERACFYFFRIRQSFGSAGGNFAMPKSRKPKDIYRSFLNYSKRLKFVTIENLTFEKLIKEYDRDETFFYCDPPYVGTENYYKHSSFGKDEHILLKDCLANIKGNFLLTYNDCEFVRELYKDFNIEQTKEIEYTLGKNANSKNSKKSVREVYISNYKM